MGCSVQVSIYCITLCLAGLSLCLPCNQVPADIIVQRLAADVKPITMPLPAITISLLVTMQVSVVK